MTAEKNKIVRVEIVAANEGPRRAATAMQRAVDAKAMLKKMVEQQVAEVLANRDDFLFQPFFQAKKVSDELKRLQTVPEMRKWTVYFEKHGCLICETKKRGHVGCGMCQICVNRTRGRLKRCVKIAEKHGQDWRKEFVDRGDLAREALAGLSGVAGDRRLKAAKRG